MINKKPTAEMLMQVLDDGIYYFSIIEKELREKEKLEKENQELSETLQLYNEKFAGFERVKADLMKENQELKKKLESEFEDSADDLCKTLTERDKLLNENIDLKFDLSLLKNAKKIEVDYSDELLEKIKNLKRENLEMKANIDSEVDFLTKELFAQQERNIDLGTKYVRLKKVIEILLGENGALLLGSNNKHKLHLVDYELVKYFISKEKYDLLREELTSEVDD